MSSGFFFRNKFLMHSRFELFIPQKESEHLLNLFEKVTNRISELENKISRFIETSDTSRLNTQAFLKPVTVDHEFFLIVDKCLEYNRRTNGYFNIDSSGTKNGLVLEPVNSTISFGSEKVNIDFGAIGKGLGIEIAIELIQNHGIQNALINFGDSSIYAIGSHPLNQFWPVSVSNQHHKINLELSDNGFSSSGLHDDGETKIAHIINPVTNEIVFKHEKVVVVSKSPLTAEVLSTAIYAADEKSRKEIEKEFPNEKILII